MTPEIAEALRAPFPPEKIGKLPRVTCGKCRDSRERCCEIHGKSKCSDCGNWITSAHIHLDFVGHADVTDRFLEVDPDWSWEPFALDATGLPKFDDNGGMWIRLTIAGTTRIGYGDADGKKGANAVKEAIGDALRNAGLRFGVALDLWRKEAVVEQSTAREREPAPPPPVEATAEQVARFDELAKKLAAAESEDGLKNTWPEIVAAFNSKQITRAQANALRAELDKRKAELAPEVQP